MNECDKCGAKLIQKGYYPEANQYKRWVCPKCSCTKKCLVCEKDFLVYQFKGGRRSLNKRPKQAVCCSKQCSKVYRRIYRNLANKFNQRKK